MIEALAMKARSDTRVNTDEQQRGARAVSRARSHFVGLRDPRSRRGKRHAMVDVVLIALLAMLCGSDDADDIAQWAELHEDWLCEWFGLEHGTPSQDTVLRVFELLQPKSFHAAVLSWLASLRPSAPGHVAIDGKTLRGSIDSAHGGAGVHVVSAWLRDAGLVLGQVKTADKSNEITAIPRLLELIDVAGCTVSIDAQGCQHAIAEKLIDSGAHYVLSVKDNQPTLKCELERLFSVGLSKRKRGVEDLAAPRVTRAEQTDAGHGRIEKRVAYFSTSIEWVDSASSWAGMTGVAMVESCRTHERTGKQETERRYFITSDATLDAARVLEQVRGHWSVENQLHWVLDVVFGEDASRIRARRAAENFGLLRRLTLSMLRSTPPPKRKRISTKAQRRICDHRPAYLMQVLGASA